MGVAIRAAIVISTAAAVYGVSKLRAASVQATQAINATNAAGASSAANARKTLRAISNTRGYVSGNKAKVIPLWQRVFGNPNPGSMTITQNNIKLAIRGTNTLTSVAREARGWYKLLWGETHKRPGGGLRALQTITKSVSQGAKEAKENVSQLSSMFAGALAAMGGVAILSGGGSVIERSLGLSRAKEDAKVTFDTLLGSRELTDDLTGRIYDYAALTPFQTADLMAASQNLLGVSGRDIDRNEELYKLAAKMAALRPGMTVEDASQAILRSTFGEFDPLKSFTISLNAEQFKGKGKAGGKAYANAVVTAIETQFNNKTNGRDIVGALAMTTTGLMSTVRDSLDKPLGNIGDALLGSSKDGAKSLLTSYITQATYFGDYFEKLMDPAKMDKAIKSGKPVFDPMISTGVKSLAEAIAEVVGQVITMSEMVIGWGKAVYAWFNGLPASAQKTIIKIVSGVAMLVTAIGVLVPLGSGLAALFEMVLAPIGALYAGISSLGIGGVAVLVVALSPLLVTLAEIVAGFMVFRKEGESLTDTMMRLGSYVYGALLGAWEDLSIVMISAWNVLGPTLLPMWERLEAAFSSIRPYFVEIADLMSGSSVSAYDFAKVGFILGDVLVWLLDKAVMLVELGIWAVGNALHYLRPYFGHIISDFKVLGKTIIEFLGGAISAKVALKTVFLGVVDIVMNPFKIIVMQLFDFTAMALHSLSDMARPYASTIADMIDASALALLNSKDAMMEGFLATRSDMLGFDSSLTIKIGGTVTADTPINFNMDGERMGEARARTEMRARNAGRGGDPMTPQEMGFVINDGRIRTVEMSAVSTSAAGGG